MIKIHKLPEPVGLRKYKTEIAPEKQSYEDGNDCFVSYRKCQENEIALCYVNAEGDSAFDELRKQLLQEQQYICAYCGSTIPFVFNENGKEQMKTEHFEPKKGAHAKPELQLTYSNLLAVCKGNEQGKGEKHCDTAKLEKPLLHIKNPASREFRSVFGYQIASEEKKVYVRAIPTLPNKEDIKTEISEILNLNEDSLASKRYTYFKVEVAQKLGKEPKRWSAKHVENLLNEYQSKQSSERLPAFYDMIVVYLNEWLRKFG